MYWNMEEPISPLLTPLPLPWQTWPHILRKIHVSLSGKLITRYLSWQTRFFLALGGAHYFSHCLTFRFEGDSSQKPKGRSSIARPPADSRHCLSCSVSLSLHSSFLEITIFHSPHSIVSNISFPPPPLHLRFLGGRLCSHGLAFRRTVVFQRSKHDVEVKICSLPHHAPQLL